MKYFIYFINFHNSSNSLEVFPKMKFFQSSTSHSSAPSITTPLARKIGVPEIPLEVPYFQLYLVSIFYPVPGKRAAEKASLLNGYFDPSLY